MRSGTVTKREKRTNDSSVEMHADFHETPPEALRALLAVEPVFGQAPVWDCAAGHGAITSFFQAQGVSTFASDLNDWPGRAADVVPGVDFLSLKERHLSLPRNIVTNPPFNLHRQFLLKALEFGTNVAFLLPATYLCGQRRGILFTEQPPTTVWMFSRRLPMMHRVGYEGPRADSQMDTAWFVWHETRRPPSERASVGWLDWEKYR